MSSIKNVTTANPDNIQDTCAYISITDDMYLSLNEINVIGDIYIKFYIKSNKANTIKLQCGNDNTTSIDVTTSWQKVEIPFTATAVFTPEFTFNVANYWIYNMKLEQASQPSQYSLAPEDYVQESENYTLDLLKNYSTTAATSSAVTAAKESVLLTAASIYATKTELNNAISLVRSDVNDKFDNYSTTQEVETIVENSKASGEPIYSVTPVGSGYWQFATLQVIKEWGQHTPIVIEIARGYQTVPYSLYISFVHSSYPMIDTYFYEGSGETVYAYLISQDSNGLSTYGLYTKVSNTSSTTDSYYSFNVINFINPIPDVVKVTWTNKFIVEPSSYLTPSAAYWKGTAATATTLATARTLTIGSTGKTFNGSANVSWTLSEIGAAASSHTHSYLPLAGGTMTGNISFGTAGKGIFGLDDSGTNRVISSYSSVTESSTSYTRINYSYATGNCYNNIYIGSSSVGNDGSSAATNGCTGYIYLRCNNDLIYYSTYGGGAFRPYTDAYASLGSSTSRWTQLYAKNATISTSDRNLKKDIENLDDRYLNLLLELQPKSFKFINNTSNRTHIGFISQDVEELLDKYNLTALDFAGFCKDIKTEQKVIKEAILDEDGNIVQEEETEDVKVLDDDGNPVYTYSLRYEEFIAINTALIQRQQKQINELTQTNTSLQELIGNLTQRLEILENKISE
jgi:cell division protein FtsB